jgi:hypothetical protein
MATLQELGLFSAVTAGKQVGLGETGAATHRLHYHCPHDA